jgi:N-methylhydantoinase A/oxoprolinase/acetone carboxylase beta subunit
VVDAALIAGMATSFHAQHDGEYGLSFPELPVELVNIRAVGTGRMPKVGAIASPSGAAKAPSRVAPVMFRVGDKVRSYPTLFQDRGDLAPGQDLLGPAIITQQDSTTIVPPIAPSPRWRAANC